MPEAGFVARTQVQSAACRPSGGIEIRQAGRADAEAIRSFITGLSPRTQYRRFFAGVSPPSSALLRGLCGTGNGADIIVAACDGAGYGGLIVGHAMAADGTAADGTPAVEVGLVVADGSQRRGIGSALMRVLLARAVARGARAVVMDVQPGNADVLAMIGRHWPGARRESTADSVLIRARLTGPALAPAPAPGPGSRALPGSWERPRELPHLPAVTAAAGQPS
ncbi:MAG TPA: GNAT family N-acetyltransferase [Streptosporangiaceae bacterium]|nr:GNAT family N-acetyltransferase [Streptosporangiaceae bacterium]